MFATLTYNKGDTHDEVTVVSGSARCFGGRKPARLACTLCRAKKVKCTGEEGGCARCKAKHIGCIYPASNERGTYAKSISASSRRSPEKDSKSNESISSDGKNVNSSLPLASDDQTRSPGSSEFDMDFSSPAFSPRMQIDAEMDERLLSLATQPASARSYPGSSLFDLNKDISVNSFDIADDFNYGTYSDPNELDLWMPADSSILHSQSQSLSPSQADSLIPNQATPGPTTHHTSSSNGNPSHFSTTTKNILSSGEDPLSDTKPCSCSQSAVQMLEELERKEYNATTLSIDVVLNDQKFSLSQFYTWLKCESCPTPKATSMLLALFIERSSVYLKKGVAHFIDELRQHQDNGHKTSTTATTNEIADEKVSINSRGGEGVGNVGEFQIESRQEWCQVVRVLLVIKCQEIISAVEKLEKKGMRDMMLSNTTRRMRRILSELMSLDGT